jgi:hypothetical protein
MEKTAVIKEPLQDWIADELATADLSDERLDKRFRLLVDRFSRKPTLSIPAACRGRAETEAAYRFFDNPRVSPQKILKPHHQATLRRIREHAVVLLPQDTTEIDLTRPQEIVGGPLNSETRRGLHDHALLAFTTQGVPLGVLSAALWARDPASLTRSRKEKKKENRTKPIADKESYRWVKGLAVAHAIARAAPMTKVIALADSESDIHECFVDELILPLLDAGKEDVYRCDGKGQSAAQQGALKAYRIIRACQDRNLQDNQTHNKLFAAVAATDVLQRLQIEVSKRDAKSGDGQKRKQARHKRLANVTVQAAKVELAAPERPAGSKVPPVTVNAVLLREVDAPAGEQPLEWLLLTDLPIDTKEEVLAVVEYYCVRWSIEIYFRVLKGGCKVEELQLETDERIKAALALYMIVAWRVLFVTRLGRDCPEMSCEAVFSPEEWQAVYAVVQAQKLPEKAPLLGEMVKMIATLGGYLGRKKDGPPGPKVMWIGLQRMADFATAWRAFGPAG